MLQCARVFAVVVLGFAMSSRGDEWKPLFDGKSLEGWNHFGEGKWVVEDGAIVGRTQTAAKLYSLLMSDGVYHDFDVRFKFKSIKGNSGFYIRMIPQSPDRAHGLQIEVDPRNDSGGVYESYRRAWVKQPDPEAYAKYFKPDDWNAVEISAHGGDVKVSVNGVTSVDLKDDPSRPAGQFALQMHAGNEVLVFFKDIEIKHTPRKGEDKKDKTSPAKVTQGDNGLIVLGAKQSTLTGGQLAYMPEWDALGFWTAGNHAAWEVEVAKAGLYDVTMEWSVADDNAGSRYVLEAGSHKLEGKVEGTKRWDLFRLGKIGQIQLDAGTQTVTLKPGVEMKGALMDLRELRLTPAKK
jgi:hypothetical protein